MKLALIAVGSLKRGHAAEGAGDYLARIARYVRVEAVEVRDGRGADAAAAEARAILKSIRAGDYVVVLDERGEQFTSRSFARRLEELLGGRRGPFKRIAFVVGGAYGLDEAVRERADMLWSLSRMTLPHDLARLVCVEQLYRAFTIMRGEPYSH